MEQQGKPSPIEEFEQVFKDRAELQARLAAGTEFPELIEAGITQADQRLHNLAANPEIVRHYMDIGGKAVAAAQEFAEIEPILSRLGFEDRLDKKRQEVSQQLAGLHPAAQYVISLQGVALPTTEEAPAELGEAATGEQGQGTAPAAAPEARAKTPPKPITITIDKNNNIRIGTRDISLSPRMQYPNGNAAKIREMRVKLLEALTEHAGEMVLAGPLLEVLGLSFDNNADRTIWNQYLRPWMEEESPLIGRKHQRLIEVDKSTPRRFRYGIVEFLPNLPRVDKEFRPENEPIYTREDGHEIGGRVGRFLVLAKLASKKKPVRLADIQGPGRVYEVEEMAAFSSTPQATFGSLRENARKELLGSHEVLRSVIVDVSSQERGYYIEYDPAEAARLKMKKAGTLPIVKGGPKPSAPDPEATEKDELERAEDVTERQAMSLSQAAILSVFLNNECQAHIAEWGLTPLDPEIPRRLNARIVDLYTRPKNDQQLRELRVDSYMSLDRLISDPERQDSFLQELEADDPEDPRINLIKYLASFDRGQLDKLQNLLLSEESDMAIDFEPHPRGGRGFIVRKVSRRRLGADGSQL